MAKRVSKRKQEKVLSPTEMRRKLLIERKHRAESRAVFSVLIPVLVLLAGFLCLVPPIVLALVEVLPGAMGRST